MSRRLGAERGVRPPQEQPGRRFPHRSRSRTSRRSSPSSARVGAKSLHARANAAAGAPRMNRRTASTGPLLSGMDPPGSRHPRQNASGTNGSWRPTRAPSHSPLLRAARPNDIPVIFVLTDAGPTCARSQRTARAPSRRGEGRATASSGRPGISGTSIPLVEKAIFEWQACDSLRPARIRRARAPPGKPQ